MNQEYIREIINKGEGINIEFKIAQSEVPKSIYDTICAFLNRIGGTILLGVSDKGEIIGIDKQNIEKIKKELTTSFNNSQVINPPIYIQPDVVEVEDKTILHLSIYESSQVHSSKGQIFDRNHEGDFNITKNTNLVAQLFIRKQGTFTENKIYPYATLKELRPDLIQRAKQMAVNRQSGHPWESLTDIQLLQSVQLYNMDYTTGQ